jgi:hypothetical protein
MSTTETGEAVVQDSGSQVSEPQSPGISPGPRSRPHQQSYLNRQPTPPLPAETFDFPSAISAQLFDAGKVDLFYTLTSRRDDTKPKAAILNIYTL